jgi:hypothetical protein
MIETVFFLGALAFLAVAFLFGLVVRLLGAAFRHERADEEGMEPKGGGDASMR